MSYPDNTVNVDWDRRLDFNKEWLEALLSQIDDFSEEHNVNVAVT